MNSDPKKISIVIATYNRCTILKSALNSLVAQKCGFPYEIIVVDNNSSDSTRSMAEEMAQKSDGKIRYIFESKQGKSYALNAGIQQAGGEIIAFVDDDIVADENWLSNLCHCLSEYDCDAIGGRVLPIYDNDVPEWVEKNNDLLFGSIVVGYDYGTNDARYNADTMLPFIGANMAFKKEVFKDCGLFRTDIGPGQNTCGEDTEFFKRLSRHGKKAYYCGRAVVHHKVDVERLRYSYIHRWHVLQGRYYARKGDIDSRCARINGVPRYLYKDIFTDSVKLVINIFNRRNFIKTLIRWSSNIGRAIESNEGSCPKSA